MRTSRDETSMDRTSWRWSTGPIGITVVKSHTARFWRRTRHIKCETRGRGRGRIAGLRKEPKLRAVGTSCADPRSGPRRELILRRYFARQMGPQAVSKEERRSSAGSSSSQAVRRPLLTSTSSSERSKPGVATEQPRRSPVGAIGVMQVMPARPRDGRSRARTSRSSSRTCTRAQAPPVHPRLLKGPDGPPKGVMTVALHAGGRISRNARSRARS